MRAGGLVDKDGSAAGSEIRIIIIEQSLVVRGEPVANCQSARSAKAQDAVAECTHTVVDSISSDQVETVVAIGCRRSTGHPNTCSAITKAFGRVRRRIECRYPAEVGLVKSDDPAVIGVLVAVRSPGNVDRAVDQRKRGPLILLQGVERYGGAALAVAGYGYAVVDLSCGHHFRSID